MAPWAFVTPASRGIGLAVTRRILQTTTCSVVATARKDIDKVHVDSLQGLDVNADRLTVLRLDVTDEDTIAAAAEHCAAKVNRKADHLRLAFILPGLLFPEKSPKQVNADDVLLTYRTNTLGPLLLMKHFSKFLPTKRTDISSSGSADELAGLPPDHAAWATLSARVGSISDNSLGGWYSYRSSKAAVNQLTKTFDNYLKTTSGDKAIAVALHPGTVRTGLSKEFWGSVREDKLFEPEWVAERLVGLVTGQNLDNAVPSISVGGRGRCWDWKGEEVPP